MKFKAEYSLPKQCGKERAEIDQFILQFRNELIDKLMAARKGQLDGLLKTKDEFVDKWVNELVPMVNITMGKDEQLAKDTMKDLRNYLNLKIPTVSCIHLPSNHCALRTAN